MQHKGQQVDVQTSIIKILLVDDNPDNLRLLATMLETEGYIVRKSLSGKMALKAAHRDPPDLILLDINMPEMNGYEVCQQLKQSEDICHIPIIFISALDLVTDKVHAFQLGGQDYITKPFQELEVLARIKNQLLIQQQQQQLWAQQQELEKQNQQLEQEIQVRRQAEDEVRRLNANLEQLNANLEQQVEIRTQELQKSLMFEALLKRITDKVRDSLDEDQILHSAVQELAVGLGIECCDTGIYDAELKVSNITYEDERYPFSLVEHITAIKHTALYAQLFQKQEVQFCDFDPTGTWQSFHQQTYLACPIFDDYGMLGNLRLVKPQGAIFDELEVRLVKQVANQCAIAIRQARLYQESQQRVQALQRITQLKDDFLNTISHELRSPIDSMKMAIQLLIALTEQGHPETKELSQLPGQNDKTSQYLSILQQECDRELALVDNLLNLQHLEVDTQVQPPKSVDLQDLILHLIEPFNARIQSQQQTLQINLVPNLPTLNLDSLSLTRIITELLNNACKYTPAGGAISISVSILQGEDLLNEILLNQDLLNEATSSLKAPSSSLQVIVANTGTEDFPAEAPEVFDQFYRIPNNASWKHGVTGIGLALVTKLVGQMEGAIAIESANNLTQFILRCPCTLSALIDG